MKNIHTQENEETTTKICTNITYHFVVFDLKLKITINEMILWNHFVYIFLIWIKWISSSFVFVDYSFLISSFRCSHFFFVSLLTRISHWLCFFFICLPLSFYSSKLVYFLYFFYHYHFMIMWIYNNRQKETAACKEIFNDFSNIEKLFC